MIHGRQTRQCCERNNILALRSRCGCRRSHNFEILCLDAIKILTIVNIVLGFCLAHFPMYFIIRENVDHTIQSCLFSLLIKVSVLCILKAPSSTALPLSHGLLCEKVDVIWLFQVRVLQQCRILFALLSNVTQAQDNLTYMCSGG